MKLLLDLTSLPTAPFRENVVLQFCVNRLQETKTPFYFDSFGNLVVGAKNETSLKQVLAKSKHPVPLFIAHSDHPGFHITGELGKNKYEWKWFGGSATQKIKGAKVYLADSLGDFGTGKITQAVLNPNKTALSHGVLQITEIFREPSGLPRSWYGAWAFSKPAWIENKTLYTRNADDFLGVSIILELARSHKKIKRPFFALISRGEEVGYIGTIGFFKKSKWNENQHQKMLAVSLETSRVLPGVEHGKGPIVRLGDRRFLFSPGHTAKLLDLAQKTLPGHFQKRIMDGGACEASVTLSLGIPTIAITLPLGNYHNQRLEGGPESLKTPLSPAPEFINVNDYEGALKLCEAIVKNAKDFSNPFDEFHGVLDRLFNQYKEYLK